MKKIKYKIKIGAGIVFFLLFAISVSATITINDTSLINTVNGFIMDFDDNWININNITIDENITAKNVTVTGNYFGGNVANWDTAYTERGSQIAGGNLSWSGGQLHAVGGSDGFYNNTKIWNSNGRYWAVSDSNLQTAINDLGTSNGVIYLPANTTITISEEIRIDDMNNITLKGNGCIFKMADGFYDTSTYLYMMNIGNSQDIIIDGLVFEQNSGEQPGRDTVGLIIEDGSDRILIENCLFNDSKDGDITISINEDMDSRGTVNLHNCHFRNFGGGTSAYSVYASNLKRLSVDQCYWSNYNISGTPQCFYLDGGNDTSYSIDNCGGENIYIFASVRFGYASFTSCLINNSYMGIISGSGSYQSDTFVTIDHCYFTNNKGGSGGGLDTCCIWVHNGQMHIHDSYITGDAPYNYYGILLEDRDIWSTTRNCLIEGCYIGNFSYGVYISGTAGNHTIRNCDLSDCITHGIGSIGNSFPCNYYDCYFNGLDQIYDTDSCLFNKCNLENISFIPVLNDSPYEVPFAGCTYYDDTEDKLYIYDGSAWDYVTVTDG